MHHMLPGAAAGLQHVARLARQNFCKLAQIGWWLR